MIVGHYAASMAAKAIEPRVPLWHYVVAAQLIDFAWAAFVLTGIERARIVDKFTESFPFDFYFMPFSHSLGAVVVWCVGTYVVYRYVRGKEFGKAALVLALVVLSHWLLDLLVHPGDLPLFSTDHKVGFALWDFPLIALLIEYVIVIAGFLMLAKHYGMSGKATLTSIVVLLALMAGIHLMFYFGMNPKSIYVIASMVFGGYVFATWVSHKFEKKFGP